MLDAGSGPGSGSTATDFYLFTMDHLHALREQYGDPDIEPERAVKILARDFPEARRRKTRRRDR